jgi:hypothetical protein
MIERGESSNLKRLESFLDIVKILKLHNFQIMEGGDINEGSSVESRLNVANTLIE